MLHLIGCFVGLAGVVVVPEEERGFTLSIILQRRRV
nr:MAG TPA: hypothetical protein [Caudoviricetes sp.]